ncbi:hypothetical protein F5Y18DRAFT_415728 [Xylariaceae sp. FL1019]|nr:hypothetical protein F5Y18DRAFT_415728 [Xylariaceae sp. FL1019]
MATGTSDLHRFEASRAQSDQYPVNLIRRQAFRHTLYRYRDQLKGDNVFHAKQSFYLLDLRVGDGHNDLKFVGVKIKNDDDLRAKLETLAEPKWRFVFLQSPTSRDPLGCTQQQLARLLTHHQVMPSFLDFVLAFKMRQAPVSHAVFRRENYLESNVPELNLPERLRSGLQIQHAFSLLSVERTNIPDEQNKWPLRQTALYHSFDVVTGQSLFAVLKGGINIASRVKDEVNNHRDLQPLALDSLEGSFIATLQIQLIILEWCSENWAEYVDDFEEKAKEKSVEVKHVPISVGTSPATIEMNFSRRSTLSRPASRTGTFTRQSTLASTGQLATGASQPSAAYQKSSKAEPISPTSPPQSPTTPPSTVRRVSSLRQSVTDLFTRFPSAQSKRSLSIDTELTAMQDEDEQNIWFDLDKILSFEKFQSLNRWCDEAEQSLMAINQNKGVLEQVKLQYSEVLNSYAFKKHIDEKSILSSVKLFFQRIDNVARDLDIYQDRLKATSHTLENVKSLYGAALEYQSAKVSEHFAHAARESSERMEQWTVEMHKIAVKTEQETVSMHVITIFTLIFLPGTFIATFFSSGVIQWNEDGHLGSDYTILPHAMALFWYVSIPILAIVLAVWALVYWVARRKRKLVADPTTGSDENRQHTMFGSMRMPSRCGRPTNGKDQDPQPEVDFGKWCDFEKKHHIGRTLSGVEEQYVPLPSLRDYWTQQRIHTILQSFDPPLIHDIKTIQTFYIRIFSTLVYASKTQKFLRSILESGLDDSHWPMTHDQFPNSRLLRSHESKGILDSQWLFCPFFLTRAKLSGALISDKHILPFTSCTDLPGPGSAVITEVEVPRHAHDLVPEVQASDPHKFVIKRYDMNHGQRSYEKEVKALTLFRNSPSPNLIEYFGSFKTERSGYLILEYADRGDLESLFDQPIYPQSPQDRKLFWTSLYRTLCGLDRVHQLMEVSKDQQLEGIQKDIKPSNILLCQGESSSLYDFVPKIADFGMFDYVRKVKNSKEEARGFNRRGDKTYGAPEVSYPNLHKSGGLISTKADIFSLGAIFSAAAAWATGGKKAKTAYFTKRKNFHRTVSTFHNSGYEGCFHDGSEVLDVVAKTHRNIRDQCNDEGWDEVTPKVLEIIQERMLLAKPTEREHAYDLIERFKRLLDDEPPLSPITSRRTETWSSNDTSASEPPGGIINVKTLNAQTQNGQVINPAVKELLDHIETNLRDRDQFFFIDDSTSMSEHKDLVLHAFKALSNIAEKLDPNKVELAFASAPRCVKRARKTKQLAKLVEKHDYRRTPELMEESLQTLFESDIIKKLPVRKFGWNLNFRARKHMSLYIFTDGNWGDDPKYACGVERPVMRLIEEVQGRKLGRNQVSLHIVRFGKSKNGKRHLDYLDDFGQEQNWDIVDVQHISSDVKAIFMGPISFKNDLQGRS